MKSYLPPSVAEHLARTSAAMRQPAWIFVGRDGSVRDTGGALRAYGLEDLRVGADARSHATFLEGLVPLDGDPIHLPWLGFGDARYADVHIFPEDTGEWVLLLDATDAAIRALPLQQRRNEETLARQGSILEAVRGFYGGARCLALRYVGGGRFRAVGAVPAWAPSGLDTGVCCDPEDAFAYLHAFLPEAQAFYRSRGAGSLASGPWTQVPDDGEELELLARAVSLEPGCRALFIGPTGARLRDRERMLQRAREKTLAHEGLSREIERRDILAHCIVHDLKGPLSCMQGYLQLAASEHVSEPERGELLQMALHQCHRQRDLIGDVLDVFSREHEIELGETPVRTIVLADVVRRVADQFHPAFEQAGSLLAIRIDRATRGVDVVGESSRAERVVANLLENALRHTPAGASATIALRLAGTEIVGTVENEGAPIPEELRPRLFERFVQGEGGGSSGLGLFFCRITLERWGGRIAYRPLRDGGACFEMRLPRAT